MGIIIGSIFTIIGLAFGASLSLHGFHDKGIIKNGVQTQGTVIDVYETTSRSSSSTTSRGSHSSSKTRITEYITVTYTVPNKGTYTAKENRRVSYSGSSRTPLNSTVTVFYDADQPNDSVVKGWESKAYSGFLFGGIFLIAGGGVVVSSIMSMRKKKSEAL
ncbi:MAG: DUF3592 domain-containing protein [Enterococcus sp.]|nr:DUF3592 domain-containing protein [Enterococcus sp.]